MLVAAVLAVLAMAAMMILNLMVSLIDVTSQFQRIWETLL